MPKVSIIIPCYNEEKTITKLLQALYDQSFPLNEMEVIISDGLSEDTTREKINSFQLVHPDLRINLVDNVKRNIPSALNTALKAAVGEFIVRLDAHSVPDQDYVRNSVNDLEAGIADNVGGVWHIQPGDDTRIAKSISLAAAHPLGVGDAGYRYSQQSAYVDTVPFGAFKRSLVESIGYFDEDLLSNEDYEFNTRIRQQGGKIWFNPEISCVYFARKSLKALGKQYFRYGFWKLKMLQRYPDSIRWRQALPPVFVLGMISLLILAIFWFPGRILFASAILGYTGILVLGSIIPARKENDFFHLIGLPMAIICMHFCWGTGFLYSMIESKIRKK